MIGAELPAPAFAPDERAFKEFLKAVLVSVQIVFQLPLVTEKGFCVAHGR